MTLVTLVWWGLWLGASFQAFRAWGPKGGLTSAVLLLLVGWVPWIGGLVSAVGAVLVGYRAENAIDARLQIRG